MNGAPRANLVVAIDRLVLRGIAVDRPERFAEALGEALTARLDRTGVPARWHADALSGLVGQVRIAGDLGDAATAAAVAAALIPDADA